LRALAIELAARVAVSVAVDQRQLLLFRETNRNGTCLVPLSALTDTEIASRVDLAIGASHYDQRCTGMASDASRWCRRKIPHGAAQLLATADELM
jgi:hypothetical protein